MSELDAARCRIPLESFASIDSEVLPASTSSRFSFKYIDISSAAEGRLTLPSESMDFADAPSRARRVLRQHDVIMSTVRPNLKAFAYCKFDAGNFIASTGFAVLRAKENAEPYFLLCAILSDDVSRQVERLAVGSNYPAISSSDVRRLLIPNFPLARQRKVAAILTSLDTAIEKTEALIEKHQQIKAGLMHDLFTRGVLPNGQLRPSHEQSPELYRDTEIGVIPQSWNVGSLASLVSSDITYGIVQAGPHVEGGVPYVRTGDMSNDYLDRSEMLCTSRVIANAYSRSEVRAGDIIVSIRATVGKVLPVPQELDGANLTQGTARVAARHGVDRLFLLWALRQRRFQERVTAVIKGTTFAEITLAALRQVPLAIPNGYAEQVAVAQRLQGCEDFLQAEIKQHEKLRLQKLGLMQDLLTGKVPVTVEAGISEPTDA